MVNHENDSLAHLEVTKDAYETWAAYLEDKQTMKHTNISKQHRPLAAKPGTTEF